MRQGKIIHLMTSLKLGGAESLVIELVRLQIKSGLDVEIISLGNSQDHFVSKAQHCDIPVKNIGHLNFWQRNSFLFKEFANAAVVHLHSPWGLRHSAPALFLQRRPRVIYTRHGNGYYANVVWRNIHALLESRIHAITFVSTAGPKIFQRWHYWPEQKIHVIENGVAIPDEIPHTTKSERDKLRIGSVGRMVALKSQDDLLKAASLLPTEKQAAIEIHFFGNGECEKNLKNLSEEKKLPATFHGSVGDIDRIYRNIDVLVVTSQNEGLSMAIMEAMAHRIPVIATNVGGNPSLVKDNQNGFLISYGKPEQLAKCIEQLLAEPALLEKFGENGQQRIREEYSLDKTAEAYSRLYFD